MFFYITRYGLHNYAEINYNKILKKEKEIWVMFGTESTGIPKRIMQDKIANCLRIPMNAQCRSLNLANSVAIVLYEILRQNNFEDLSVYEVQKGKDFILKKD